MDFWKAVGKRSNEEALVELGWDIKIWLAQKRI
jgi:hypothetical protein